MDTWAFVLKKFNIKRDVIEIPGVGRDDLAKLFGELGFKVGAELGVAAGEYSAVIMKYNPDITLYGVDPYISYSGYKDYTRKETFNALEERAHALLDKYPTYKFVRKMSLEAAEDFEDESLDFVYIDANHAEPFVTQDIEAWAPKVRKGGIVSGHDYAHIRGADGADSRNWAVIGAINRYAKKHGIQLFIWGLEAKIPGLKRESIRSWMFVKD